jgi:extracellular matrix protein 14
MRLARIALLGILAIPPFALSEPLGTPTRSFRQPARHHAAVPRDTSTNAYPTLKWLRDFLAQLAFGKPASTSPNPPAPRNTWASYKDDVVVRFNVSEPQEEIAIADAVERLFKDLWSFGDQYVDIRMRRDDVASFLSILPESLQSSYTTLIPDLAALIVNSYPANYIDGGNVDFSGEAYVAPEQELPMLNDNNIFFENYQPLTVSCGPPLLLVRTGDCSRIADS